MSMMCGYFPGRHLDKIKLSLLLWSRHSNCERFIHKRYGISAGTQIKLNNSLKFVVLGFFVNKEEPAICNQLNDVAFIIKIFKQLLCNNYSKAASI